jgi:hypothetical protein
MIMLLAHPPNDCPSIPPELVQALVALKYNSVGTPLTTVGIDHTLLAVPVGGPPVDNGILDIINREQITCLGLCENYESFKKYYAAVYQLHDNRAPNGSEKFESFCPNCRSNFQSPESNLTHNPCDRHSGQHSKYISRGNPILHSVIKELKTAIAKEGKRRQYSPTSASPLLPSEVIRLQHYTIEHLHCPRWDFQNYTLLLGAIAHASRYDGFHDASHDDFNNPTSKSLIEASPTSLVSLGQGVFEKSDNAWSYYLVEFNDHQPKLCYLRHLLVWVHCMHQSNGYLYGNQGSVESLDPQQPNCFGEEDKLDYRLSLEWLKDLVKKCLPDSACSRNTSWHLAKITYYLWMTLGGAPLEASQKGARHRTKEMAMLYWKDAMTIYHWLESHPAMWAQEPIFPGKLHLVETRNGVIQRLIQSIGGIDIPNLASAAKFFVGTMLCVSPLSSNYRDLHHLINLSYSRRFRGLNVGTELQELLKELDVSQRARVLSLFNMQHSHQHQPNTANGPPRLPTQDNHRLIQPSASHDGKYRIVLPSSHDFQMMSTSDVCFRLGSIVRAVISIVEGTQPIQVDIGHTLYEQFMAGKKKVQRTQQSLFSRYLSQFAKSLLVDHTDDLQSFIEANPSYERNKVYICRPPPSH